MRKLYFTIAALLAATLIAGCGKSESIENKSRAEQEKAFAGDPVKGQEIGRQMREKYFGPGANPRSPQQSAPAPTAR